MKDYNLLRKLAGKYPYFWYWKSKLPERKGTLCKVISRGKANSILIEFEDGVRVITSRHAVRRHHEE